MVSQVPYISEMWDEGLINNGQSLALERIDSLLGESDRLSTMVTIEIIQEMQRRKKLWLEQNKK